MSYEVCNIYFFSHIEYWLIIEMAVALLQICAIEYLSMHLIVNGLGFKTLCMSNTGAHSVFLLNCRSTLMWNICDRIKWSL